MPDKNSFESTTPEHLIALRRELHNHPALSGDEAATAAIIEQHFIPLQPDHIYRNLGGHGIAFEFSGPGQGKTVMFRADLDALPINEETDLEWASANHGVSHKCGHDGHMTILSGLGELISRNRPRNGRVILLFQPEEETGTGAAKVIADQQFSLVNPDYVFGLHNLPGFPTQTIILKRGTFAAASKGMIIRLSGRTAHAGQPETGISPAGAIARLIDYVNGDLVKQAYDDFVLATVIHIKLGEVAFGTAPGEAEFMLTLRSLQNDDMEKLTAFMEEKARAVASAERLHCTISYTEEFPATINHDEGMDILEQAAADAGLMMRHLKESFRWSEDFGHYLEHAGGAFFGLGAGTDTPQLHNPDYDFPDGITTAGIKMFYAIYEHIFDTLRKE